MKILDNEKYLKIGNRIDKKDRHQKDSDYYVRKVIKNTFNDILKNVDNIEDVIFMNEEKLNKKDYYIKLVVNILKETNTNILQNNEMVNKLAKEEQGQIELIKQVSKFANYLTKYEHVDYNIKGEMIEEVEDVFWTLIANNIYTFDKFKKEARHKIYQVKRNALHEEFNELGVEEHETNLLSYFDSEDFKSRQDLDQLKKSIYKDILNSIKNELITTYKEDNTSIKKRNIACIKGYLMEQKSTLNLSKSQIEELGTIFYEMVEKDLFVKE